jgi:hypothetical protein
MQQFGLAQKPGTSFSRQFIWLEHRDRMMRSCGRSSSEMHVSAVHVKIA